MLGRSAHTAWGLPYETWFVVNHDARGNGSTLFVYSIAILRNRLITKFKMVMNKTNIKKIVIGGIGFVLMLAIGYGIYAFVQYVNGTSPAQIESRRRAQEAAEQSEKALREQSQWYQDMMSEPVTVKNSDGEEVTYGTKTATCIESSIDSEN